MTYRKLNALILAWAFAAGIGVASPAWAHDDTCNRWDETQSLRCFDCMKRVWTGYEWQLVNTCKPRPTFNRLVWLR